MIDFVLRKHPACSTDHQTQPAGTYNGPNSLPRLPQETCPALAAYSAHPAAFILLTSSAQMSFHCQLLTLHRRKSTYKTNDLREALLNIFKAALANKIDINKPFFHKLSFIRNLISKFDTHKYSSDSKNKIYSIPVFQLH